MKTEDTIKELELNYGYTFAKEGTDSKWQFEWICEMINDVQNVVTKNCNLHIVSNRTLTPKPSRYKCLLCGRDKFTRKSPHNCNHGFRKRNIKWQPIFD